MDPSEHSVSAHYAHGELEETIALALGKIGRARDGLSIDDLASVSEYHIRGRDATRELLSWTKLSTESRVLDVGCGIGGACRYVASEYGAHVTGIDLSAEFCRVAEWLSKRTGHDELTRFQQGTALDMPFPDERFDLTLSQHVQMNVRDKRRYFSEISRVTSSGGELALYEICSGPRNPVHYPVPWAGEESVSFLSPPETLRSLLREVGLQPKQWEDVTTRSLAWFEEVLEKTEREGPPAVGLHLLMGEEALKKMKNVRRNLREERISVVQAVLRRQ